MTITRRENKKEPEYIGTPDGPPVYIPQFDCEVGTFLARHMDMESPVYRNAPCLMYHVPITMRGPYAPQAMANYDEKIEYTVDSDGLAICGVERTMGPGSVNFNGGKYCRRRAVNRSGWCQNHGGKLHPLDKQKQKIRDPSTMDRWELLQYGYIDADDLDDEELVKGMARRPDGSLQPGSAQRMIPRELYDKLVSRMFERANEKLRQATLSAVDVMVEIMEGDAFEATDRKDAAKFVIERMMGKAPQTIDLQVGIQKPYEQILSGIAPLTREQSRAQRVIANGNTIEGEVVEYVPATETDVRAAGDGAIRNGDELRRDPYSQQPADDAGQVTPWTQVTTLADRLNDNQTQAIHSLMGPPENAPESNAPSTINTQSNADIHATPPGLSEPSASNEDTPALTKEALKEKIQKARNRRYAARGQGRTTTSDLGFVRQVEPYDYQPIEGSQYNKPTKFLVKYVHPDDVKVPPTVKAKETKARNRFRRRTADN